MAHIELLFASRRITITTEVDGEIQQNRAALEAAIGSGSITRETLVLSDEADLFARLTRRLSVADASCIVLATLRGADLAADDIRLRQESAAILSADRLLGTEDLLAEAVISGLLSLREGNDLLHELPRLRYRPKVASLQELVPFS